jgi:hypothetical protein
MIKSIACLAALLCCACSPAIHYDKIFHDAGRTIRNVSNDGYRTITGDPLDPEIEAYNETHTKYPGLLPSATASRSHAPLPPDMNKMLKKGSGGGI